MANYSKLNKNIKLLLEDDVYYVNFMNLFDSLSIDYLHILEEYLEVLQLDEEFDMNVSYFENLKQSLKFLKSIDNKYYEILKTAYKNDNIKIDINHTVDAGCYYLDKNKYIDLPLNFNLDDSFCLVHEFVHYLNLKEEISYSRKYLTETFSILFEMLYSDFLERKNYYNKDYLKILLLRFSSCFDDANELYSYGGLINVFLNNGKIDSKSLTKYCNQSDMEELEFQCHLYNESIPFFDNKKYLLGIYLACDMHQHLINDSNYINKILYLIENINDLSIIDCFKVLDLNLNNYDNNWMLDSNSYNRILGNLKLELEKIYKKFKDVENEKSYCYSRTNRCW